MVDRENAGADSEEDEGDEEEGKEPE